MYYSLEVTCTTLDTNMNNQSLKGSHKSLLHRQAYSFLVTKFQTCFLLNPVHYKTSQIKSEISKEKRHAGFMQMLTSNKMIFTMNIVHMFIVQRTNYSGTTNLQ